MKKYTITIFILSLTLLLIGCTAESKQMLIDNLDETHISNSLDTSSVKLDIVNEEITYDTEVIEIVYSNTSDEEFSYGEAPHLEVKLDDKWYIVPYQEDANWSDLAYILLPEDKYKDEFFVTKCYGNLYPGNYRFIKEFSNPNRTTIGLCEFKVD